MKKHKNLDPIDGLNEWQEHMYNPGYWINRFSPFFPPRRGRLAGCNSLISLAIVLPIFIILIYVAITRRELVIIFTTLIVGLLVLTYSIWLYRFWPRRNPKSQVEIRDKKRRK
jgi:hypothetical protein